MQKGLSRASVEPKGEGFIILHILNYIDRDYCGFGEIAWLAGTFNPFTKIA